VLSIFFAGLLLATLLSACGSKDPLIGTWQEPTSGIMLTFNDSSQVIMSLHETSYTFTYTEPSTNQLDVKVTDDGSIPDLIMNYQVNPDTLTITVNGADTVFNRVKTK